MTAVIDPALLEQLEAPDAPPRSIPEQITRAVGRTVRAGVQGLTAIPNMVGDALGLPDWRAERLYRQARAYREEELVRVMEVLAETDVEMKGGDLPPDIALERAVVQIVDGA